MAKKGQRIIFGLVCETCKSRNYITEKNKLNTKDKLSFKKYCKRCKKITLHKESGKLD
ncbi:50S ribosomal protein L33 [Candidatus Microgenomates bacterium]|nr:MAG: 50S ribosomal protein L33 [Candidatus Microgenomates bacterium]